MAADSDEALDATQKRFLRLYLQAPAAAPSDTDPADIQASIESGAAPPLTQCETLAAEWAEVAGAGIASFQKIRAAIMEDYEPYPDLAEQVQASLANMDILNTVLSSELAGLVRKTARAQDGDKRAKLAQTALGHVQKRIQFFERHPIGLAIDTTEVQDAEPIAAPSLKTLRALETGFVAQSPC